MGQLKPKYPQAEYQTVEGFLQCINDNHRSQNPLLRAELTSEQITIANKLSKEGKILKTHDAGGVSFTRPDMHISRLSEISRFGHKASEFEPSHDLEGRYNEAAEHTEPLPTIHGGNAWKPVGSKTYSEACLTDTVAITTDNKRVKMSLIKPGSTLLSTDTPCIVVEAKVSDVLSIPVDMATGTFEVIIPKAPKRKTAEKHMLHPGSGFTSAYTTLHTVLDIIGNKALSKNNKIRKLIIRNLSVVVIAVNMDASQQYVRNIQKAMFKTGKVPDNSFTDEEYRMFEKWLSAKVPELV